MHPLNASSSLGFGGTVVSGDTRGFMISARTLDISLDAAYDWVDVILGYDDYLDAVRFADLIANQDGLLFKEVATVAAPVPYDYFLRHQKFFRRGQSAVLVMVAPHALDPFLMLAKRYTTAADEHVTLSATYRGTKIAQASAIHDHLARLARDSAKEATAAAEMHKQLAAAGR